MAIIENDSVFQSFLYNIVKIIYLSCNCKHDLLYFRRNLADSIFKREMAYLLYLLSQDEKKKLKSCD